MSRYHWWGFIVNEAGEPIENAEITIKLAGSEELASLYFDEFGNANSIDSPSLSGSPQLSTLSNGYYEFWIGDTTEPHGYRNEQKFKIEWMRIGVAHGEIDYINVFPLGPQIEPLSITDCSYPSIDRNKLISNSLGCKWNTHVDSEVIMGNGDFQSVHGLEFILLTELDTLKNKILSNHDGYQWETHRMSTVQNPAPSGGLPPYDGYPHGIEEVNPYDGSSSLRNKVVSNRDLYNIHNSISDLTVHVDTADTYLQSQIDDLSWTTDQSQSGWWEVYPNDWIYDVYDVWFVNISHNLDIWFPFVQCWDKDTGKLISTTDIEFLGVNSIKVSIDNSNSPNAPLDNIIVRIGNGGVHRHP